LPGDRVLDLPAEAQQLAARLIYEDGSERDVTRLVRYESSNESIAQIEPGGLVRKVDTGEATILVNFDTLVTTTRMIFREPVEGYAWTDPPENNMIDKHIFAKLKLLRLPPSELSDDPTFLRRAHLGIIGLPPNAE